MTILNGLFVTLDGEDLTYATDVGRMRHLESILNGRKVKFPEKRHGELWGNHIESACAELAVARCSRRKWTGHINRFHERADIEGTNWEVRWSAIQQWKVNATNDTGKVVVCVDGQAPTYEIVGWVIPELVRQQDALKRHGKDHDFWLVPRKLITRVGLPPASMVLPEHWRLVAV